MGPRKGARGVCNISIETRDSQNKKPKKIKKSKNVSDDDEEGSKNTLWSYCLGPHSRIKSREKWIQCIACKLWAHEK